MPKVESLNDIAPKSTLLPKIRIGAIRDIIQESNGESEEMIRNKVHAFCIEKNLGVVAVILENDEEDRCIKVVLPQTSYYFKVQ